MTHKPEMPALPELIAELRECRTDYEGSLMHDNAEPIGADCGLLRRAEEAIEPRSALEQALDAADSILHRLEGWGRAYPEDMFREVTKAECDKLRKEWPGMIDRISAGMGRHMARCIHEDLAQLRSAINTLEATPASDGSAGVEAAARAMYGARYYIHGELRDAYWNDTVSDDSKEQFRRMARAALAAASSGAGEGGT